MEQRRLWRSEVACRAMGFGGAQQIRQKRIRRVAKMALKGLELSCSWDMEPMWHPSWKPF
jgi:hypothetical protein